MLIEGTLAVLAVLAWKKAGSSKRGQMDEERERMYLAALEDLTDTVKLRALADSFQKWGYPVQAKMLRARADLRDISSNPEQKKARREAYDKAMKSENVEAILKVADAFERATATGAAAKLRQHANEVISKLSEARVKKAEEDLKAKEEIKVKTEKGSDNMKNGTSEVIEVVPVQTIPVENEPKSISE